MKFKAGQVLFNYFENIFYSKFSEDVIADISVNLNEAIEQILNDFDNLSPRKKTSMKSLKPKKRKVQKAQNKSTKKQKLERPDEFFEDEAAEGILSFYLNFKLSKIKFLYFRRGNRGVFRQRIRRGKAFF